MAVGSELEYVIEGKDESSITSNSCFDAIIALLASFYIFNIEYCQTKSVLSALETIVVHGQYRKWHTTANEGHSPLQ